MRIRILVLLLLLVQFFYLNTKAAFDVVSVRLFRDTNVCINKPTANGTQKQSVDFKTFGSSSQSVRASISSSGSFCSLPPFFTGGAKVITKNGISVQAGPTVQSYGRGILISEVAGTDGGVSGGDPSGFDNLGTMDFGSMTTSLVFEISLPSECDVIDDDDDIAGDSSILSGVNDFSLPTCSSTDGVTVVCNAESGALTASNGLVPASGTSLAKSRFVISSLDTIADPTMIDSVLIKFRSQDIFCPNGTSGPLTATIVAKDSVTNPAKTVTIGQVDLGTSTQALSVGYAKDIATSSKGETSENEVATTPILVMGSATALNSIEIKELNEESIPIGSDASAVNIDPSRASSSTDEITEVFLLLIPSKTNFFSKAPLNSDVTLSDNSFIVNGEPFIVTSSTISSNFPVGTLVIKLKKNTNPGATNPDKVKTTVKIANIVVNPPLNTDETGTISFSIFEPDSGAIVNTPGALSINTPTDSTKFPQNFSAFSVGSKRALEQNKNGDDVRANQIITDTELAELTSRNTELGAPQITNVVKAVSNITPINETKVAASVKTNADGTKIATIKGGIDSSIGGARIKVDTLKGDGKTVFDSVIITSLSDGSFTAKLQADSVPSKVNLIQTVSDVESTVISKTLQESAGLACEEKVCGCEDPGCTPSIGQVVSYIETNGGLNSIVSQGGDILNELIESAKKALGLT